ncbi:MAG TPA: response regulator [Terriglobales bacterium]|nr:response regulator [Terriglobales bacterium]
MADATADLILLVDDDATGRSVRKLVLETQGHNVLAVGDAPSALRTLATEPVCLVIVDYFLRDTTGAELAKTMREVKPEVPILLLSASGEMPQGAEYADAYLSKLEPIAVVESTIGALLDKRRRSTP